MIENLKCCLAHPMTALRTLKEKINEVITGHNSLVEKVDNLPAGGGSAEGGSSGPGAFVITASCDSNAEGTEYTNAVKDKTFAEIMAAYANGESIELRLSFNGGAFAGYNIVYPNYAFISMEGVSAFMFNHWSTVMPNLITLMPDDTMSVVVD